MSTTYFLLKRLPNGGIQTAAWCIRQKIILSTTQRESNGDGVWPSSLLFSSLVSGVAFVPACGTSVHIVAETS